MDNIQMSSNGKGGNMPCDIYPDRLIAKGSSMNGESTFFQSLFLWMRIDYGF